MAGRLVRVPRVRPGRGQSCPPASCSSSPRRSVSIATACPVAALWVGAAILTIAALRMAHARDDSAWMGKRRQSLWSALPAAVACALFATTGAVAVAPQLPGAGAKALLDTRNRDGDVTEVVSPLVDIRSRLVNRGNVELFTVDDEHASIPGADRARQVRRHPVDDAAGEHRVRRRTRLADATGQRRDRAAADHDQQARRGSCPGSSHSHLRSVAGPPAVVGGRGRRAVRRRRVEAELPVPGDVGRQRPVAGRAARRHRSTGAPTPSTTTCRTACPTRSRDLALAVTAQARHAVRQGTWRCRTGSGRSSSTRLTVQRGHSNDAMLNFLRIRKGYCEQFPARSRAMARVVGSADPGDGRASRRACCAPTACTTSPVATPTRGTRCGSTATDGCCSTRRPAAAHRAPSSTPALQPAQEEGNGTGGGTVSNDTPTPTSTPSSPPPIDPRPRGRPARRHPAIPSLDQRVRRGLAGRLDRRRPSLLAIVAWVVAMPRVINRWSRHARPATRPTASRRRGQQPCGR